MQEGSDEDDRSATTSTSTANGHHGRVHPTVSFRILCPVASSGGLIGKSGAIVKLLEKETGAKIRVEGTIHRCEERAVNISSAKEPKTTITLNKAGKEEEEEQLEVEVSPAQYALIRVLERVLEVGEELEEGFQTPLGSGKGKGLVSCRLLADHSQIGCLMGYGGDNMKKIQGGSGAKIKVFTDCPACASPNDELIQIAGESLALKKAVLAVSQCLQDSPPLEKAKMIGSKSYRAAPSMPPVEFLPRHSSSPRVNSSVDYTSRNYSLLAEEEVVFRLICPDDTIGGIIGKGGSIVKALQDQTGASISVAAPVAESEDRIIHVSALENVESQYSPAQAAVICVFARSIEVGNGKMPESSPKRIVEARVVVSKDQIGCLIGKGGAIMSEMRKATRTNIWALPPDQLPSCVPENDKVVRIIGGVQNVQDALLIVTSKLRDFCFPSKRINSAGRFTTPNYVGPYASAELSHELGPYALTDSMHRLELANHLDHSPSPMQLQSRLMSGENFGGVMNNGRRTITQSDNLEHGSSVSGGTGPAIVTNAMLEILVPANALGSVYDEKESNLDRIRQISGASVTASKPNPGTNMLTVFISGTPGQTQAAQMVLQAFIHRS